MPTTLNVTLARTPGVCGGNLRLDGTRMTVNQIVTLHQQGLSAEQIVEQYPHRTLREIYAVLAWYYEHRAEFDEELAAEAERLDIYAFHVILYVLCVSLRPSMRCFPPSGRRCWLPR